jgi:hypothetical protein
MVEKFDISKVSPSKLKNIIKIVAGCNALSLTAYGHYLTPEGKEVLLDMVSFMFSNADPEWKHPITEVRRRSFDAMLCTILYP